MSITITIPELGEGVDSVDVVAVLVSVLAISFLATLYPAWKASRLQGQGNDSASILQTSVRSSRAPSPAPSCSRAAVA